jgi:hypothetical protein
MRKQPLIVARVRLVERDLTVRIVDRVVERNLPRIDRLKTQLVP